MKLNPFNKKSTAYYDKVKAEYDKLDREIAAAKEELAKAEADHDRKRRRHFELTQRGSMYSSSPDETQASMAASAARVRGASCAGPMSGRSMERSRRMPWASSMPARSAPGWP